MVTMVNINYGDNTYELEEYLLSYMDSITISSVKGKKAIKTWKKEVIDEYSHDKSDTDKEIEMVFKGVPVLNYEKLPLIEFLVQEKVAASKREAREFLSGNAISVNGTLVNDENYLLDEKRKYNIIRRGKKKYYLVLHKND